MQKLACLNLNIMIAVHATPATKQIGERGGKEGESKGKVEEKLRSLHSCKINSMAEITRSPKKAINNKKSSSFASQKRNTNTFCL